MQASKRQYLGAAGLLLLVTLSPAIAYSHAGCFAASLATVPPPAEHHPDNSRSRTGTVQLIVLHTTGGPSCNPRIDFAGGTLATNIRHFLSVSASTHYLIGKNGSLVQMVEPDSVAFHARENNPNSIGIELVNNGDGKDPFSFEQLTRLYELLTYLMGRYNLTTANIKTHAELDQRYMLCQPPSTIPIEGVPKSTPGARKMKQDPGDLFPWGAYLRSFLETAPDRVAPEDSNSQLPMHHCEYERSSPSTLRPGAPVLIE